MKKSLIIMTMCISILNCGSTKEGERANICYEECDTNECSVTKDTETGEIIEVTCSENN